MKCLSCRYGEWVSGYGCWIRLHFDRPVSFSRRRFFFLCFFISFCVPLFSAFMWRGYGFQLFDRATVVSVNKNKQKIGRTMPNTESIIRWKRDDERVSIVNLRALSVCTRARALPLPWNQRDFLVSLSLSPCNSVCLLFLDVEIKNTHRFNLRYHPTRFVRRYCDEILAGMKCWYGGSLAICYLPAGWQQTFLWLRYTTSANTNWRSL